MRTAAMKKTHAPTTTSESARGNAIESGTYRTARALTKQELAAAMADALQDILRDEERTVA